MSIFDSTLLEIARKPDVWETAANGDMYLGFAKPGTISEDSETFLIVKVEKVSETRSRKLYAEGSKDFNKAFNQYATFNYFYAK